MCNFVLKFNDGVDAIEKYPIKITGCVFFPCISPNSLQFSHCISLESPRTEPKEIQKTKTIGTPFFRIVVAELPRTDNRILLEHQTPVYRRVINQERQQKTDIPYSLFRSFSMQPQKNSSDCRRRRLFSFLLCTTALVFALCMGSVVSARAVTQATIVLAVHDFNADGVADSLVGTRSGRQSFLSRVIHWGTGGWASVAQTSFTYPSWSALSGSCAVSDINDDGIQDLVFYIQGTSAGVPVSRMLLMLGGTGLAQSSVIDIATLPSQQSWPFTSKDLSKGTEFTQEAVRDLLGDNSYRLHVVFGSPMLTDIAGQEQAAWSIYLYPNPSSKSANIEGRGVMPGQYRIQVLSLQGTVVYEHSFTVGNSGGWSGTLDLHTLVSGTYMVRCTDMASGKSLSYSLVLIQ